MINEMVHVDIHQGESSLDYFMRRDYLLHFLCPAEVFRNSPKFLLKFTQTRKSARELAGNINVMIHIATSIKV